ncbi:Solute carrier family 13 member 4, partial [Ophiophagus hannah]
MQCEMTVAKEFLQARNLLLVVLIPLLLLPLPLLCPTSEASCAYVLIVTAIYWVSEAVPLGAAALVPAFLYPLFGVMKSSEVAAEYVKNTTLLLIGVICVAASVEKWNLHKRIALRMELVKSEEDHEMNGTAGSTLREEKETISLGDKHGQGSLELIFINEETNGQHLPQAQILVLPSQPQNLDQHSKKQYPSKHDHMICKCLSLSISYAATIGGLTTIIGTSTNLIFLEYFNNHYPNSDVVNFGTWFLFSLPISLIMLFQRNLLNKQEEENQEGRNI